MVSIETFVLLIGAIVAAAAAGVSVALLIERTRRK
ncbi:ABC-type Fe3+ transport system permease subunit [Paraburkholderia silvatlantica]|uniref:ABC-type Fe3+ transport system permease subunit n=1 Tax=Paraburkholderia silvatlantica TaxID=321895 RepID=A0ABR6FLR2_9BURK|nr:ABC-type Fe3+ transport system permease subunit [Paraburkholderia silvatlantica]